MLKTRIENQRSSGAEKPEGRQIVAHHAVVGTRSLFGTSPVRAALSSWLRLGARVHVSPRSGAWTLCAVSPRDSLWATVCRAYGAGVCPGRGRPRSFRMGFAASSRIGQRGSHWRVQPRKPLANSGTAALAHCGETLGSSSGTAARCLPPARAAANPHSAAKDSHNAGMARFPVW